MIKPTHKGVTAPSNYQEQNDCSVRSIANASGVSYGGVHTLLKSLGRKDGDTTSDRNVAIACVTLGGKLKLFQIDFQEQYQVVQRTLKRYLPYLQTGNFVVITSQHSFAMVNGDIIDNQEIDESEIVTCVYEFNKESKNGG